MHFCYVYVADRQHREKRWPSTMLNITRVVQMGIYTTTMHHCRVTMTIKNLGAIVEVDNSCTEWISPNTRVTSAMIGSTTRGKPSLAKIVLIQTFIWWWIGHYCIIEWRSGNGCHHLSLYKWIARYHFDCYSVDCGKKILSTHGHQVNQCRGLCLVVFIIFLIRNTFY